MREIKRNLGAVAGPARVRNDVADVFHAGAEEDEALEAQTKAGVHHGAVPPQFRDAHAHTSHHTILF